MRKKGFTLVELLAVIIILGIIMVITIPNLFNNVKESKDKAYDVLVDVIKNSAQLYAAKHKDEINVSIDTNDSYTVTVGELINEGFLNAPILDPRTNADVPNENTVTITRNELGSFFYCYLGETCTPGGPNIIDTEPPLITLEGDSTLELFQGDVYSDAGATAFDNIDGNITDRISVVSTVNMNAIGTYTVTYNVSDNHDNDAAQVVRTVNVVAGDYIANKGVNRPKLVTGMTAVKWNGSSWTAVANPDDDTSWYDYSNKQWANARTDDGSMWVWIPRYVYRVATNWHINTTGTIDIQFSIGTDDTRGGSITLDTGTGASASNNNWTNHPAFTFGNTELNGIWVAKYEASVADTSNVCYTTPNVTNCNVITIVPKIVPNAYAWRFISIGNAFVVSNTMEMNSIYGWNINSSGFDTHLIKNIEWGAVTYLSKSIYGMNTSKIWINPASNSTTGCAGDSEGSAQTATCLRTFNTTNGYKASTTGTIYGVYDMSGGSYEFVAAYVNNGTANLTTYGSSILNANAKYKDVYTVGAPDNAANNYAAASNKKGDAIYETAGATDANNAWFAGNSYMVTTTTPWFERGGYYSSVGNGGPFNFYKVDGQGTALLGFRPVLLVAPGI